MSTYLTESIKALYDEDKRAREDRLGLAPPVDPNAEGDAAATDTAATTTDTAAASTTADAGASGEGGDAGWVIQINGYHYHNGKEYAGTSDEQEDFVLKTLIHRLETGSVKLPLPDGQTQEFTFKELGFSNPFVLPIGPTAYNPDYKIPNPEWIKRYGNAQAARWVAKWEVRAVAKGWAWAWAAWVLVWAEAWEQAVASADRTVALAKLLRKTPIAHDTSPHRSITLSFKCAGKRNLSVLVWRLS